MCLYCPHSELNFQKLSSTITGRELPVKSEQSEFGVSVALTALVEPVWESAPLLIDLSVGESA